MTRWTGIVLALPTAGGDDMASRLATHQHPVAGRPLVWHTVAGLASLEPAPARLIVVAEEDLSPDLFQDVPVDVLIVSPEEATAIGSPERLGQANAMVVDAVAPALDQELQSLLARPVGGRVAALDGGVAAAWLDAATAGQLLRSPDPRTAFESELSHLDILTALAPLEAVRSRAQLARFAQRVRDRLVQALMGGGVTFILPESVMVDVDVRIGRDSVVYPGVVLEGQTTIGEETVVGPGCRIIDSWVGSGVELKGWNYISHTSIRNRAILEPYVRRGFD